MKTEYYKTRLEHRNYKGERYFKWTPCSDTVVQVCVSEGEVKRGRGNGFGIHVISTSSFFANYMGNQYVIQCTKNAYELAFKKVVKYLK